MKATSIYSKRRAQFIKTLASRNIDGAIVSKKENIYYLTGLASLHPTERESYLIISPESSVLYHSPFVIPVKDSQLTTIAMSRSTSLSHILANSFSNVQIVGIEKLDINLAEYERFQSILTTQSFIDVDTELAKMRFIKYDTEFTQIKKACYIASEAAKWVHLFLSQKDNSGVTEIEVAHRLEQKMFELGANGIAFPTIVAFDAHSASPHHIPTGYNLRPNSVVLVDFGAKVNGYMSDITRTWAVKKPSDMFKKIEQIVQSAYTAAFRTADAISESLVLARSIDIAARSVIESAGFGDQFIHTTGHGIGLEAHESPSINSANEQEIAAGMVITIEPGIYLPGQFGYRHENTVLITSDSALELT